MNWLNLRTIFFQLLVFLVQWLLMILGFYLLVAVIAPSRIFDTSYPFERFIDAALKALIAFLMSVFWLFVWDRQVRIFFYNKRR